MYYLKIFLRFRKYYNTLVYISFATVAQKNPAGIEDITSKVENKTIELIIHDPEKIK
jgi:hypothetical protein